MNFEMKILKKNQSLYSWNPPGHGNIYVALKESGKMDELLSKGRDIVFVSNIDNTGAEVRRKEILYPVNPL